MPSTIPLAVQQVVDLFKNNLPHAKFGDLDATVFAAAAEEVDVAAIALAQAEAALDGARARFNEKQDALLQKAQRGLAYARVYAEGDAELSARVDTIALPRVSRRAFKADEAPEGDNAALASSGPLPRRRGRPRNAERAGKGELLDLSVGDVEAVAS